MRALLINPQLPTTMDDKKRKVDRMTWWSSLNKRYPAVFKMVTVVLSIFHGPRVESSFIVMGDVIDKKSGRMNMETYSSIKDIKYGLQARQPSADNHSVKEFSRKNRLFTPVNPTLAKNMQRAYSVYSSRQKEKMEEEKKRWEEFQVETDSTTQKKLKLSNAAQAEEAHIQHQKIINAAYNPKRKLSPEDDTSAKKPSKLKPLRFMMIPQMKLFTQKIRNMINRMQLLI